MTLWLHIGFLILETTAVVYFWHSRYLSGFLDGCTEADQERETQLNAAFRSGVHVADYVRSQAPQDFSRN